MALSSAIWAYAVDALARAFLSASAKRTNARGSALRCPRCAALAVIKETKAKEDNTMRRRYECSNLHRFTTIEFVRPDSIASRKISDRANKSAED